MNKDKTLQEIINLLRLQSDTDVRCLLDTLLEDVRKDILVNPVLDKQLDLESLLKHKKAHTLPQLHDLDTFRKIRKQLEERIEALLERIKCLLEELRKQRKLGKDLVKHVPLQRKRLLKLLLSLINLINLKNLLENLESISDKRK
ncbi:hypothetical protein [Bacillus sp. FJAT-45350]|uniref:hypothetical protein n=1 Tax=Bacillus sp. FJAT-45350 TaxID=2011014 RepID=UPI000BB7C4C0|nr:hypothetical protein [Bacillus sp. FJAT-45350]